MLFAQELGGWEQLIAHYGAPLAIFLLVLRWARPKLDAWIEADVEMRKSLSVAMPTITKSQDAIHDILLVLAWSVKAISKLIPSRDPCILLVEDSAPDQLIFRSALKDSSLPVVVVTTVEEAMIHLYSAVVIVLDVTLPHATIETHRFLTVMSPCPVIFWTGSDDPKVALMAKTTGAAFVKKDIDQTALVHAVDAALEKSNHCRV